MKKQPKAKEPIKIRFKELANGSKSIYLDIYTNGLRKYEFLKLYIVPERTPIDKKQNEQTLRAANAIKAQRIIDVANERAGLQTDKGRMYLADWLQSHQTDILNENKNVATTSRMIAIVNAFAGPKTRLCDVDLQFCKGLIYFMLNVYKTSQNKPLKPISAREYFTRFEYAMNEAVRNGLLDHNPTHKLQQSDKIKAMGSPRAYLEKDEVQQLILTPCGNDEVKRAFLFSCFCGLRYSDIKELKWSDIHNDGEHVTASIVQQKTKAPLYVNLSKEALSWLPGQKENDTVFDLPTLMSIEYHIARWSAAAGIKKHVTFHVARHTFATLSLTLGADLYTVSKLLGHSDIKTTQVYAKIIDQKKEAAVSLFNDIFRHE